MSERPKRASVSEPSGRGRKKRNLSEVERSQISQFHHEHPLVTHNNIASIFGVERSTVSKILQNQHSAQLASTGFNTSPAVTEDQLHLSRSSKSDHGELRAWAQAAQRLGIPLTREILRKQAAIIAAASWKTQQELTGCSTSETAPSGSSSSSASPPVASYEGELSRSGNKDAISWNWEEFIGCNLTGNGDERRGTDALQLQPTTARIPNFVSDSETDPFSEVGYPALDTMFPGCGCDGNTAAGPTTSNIGADVDYTSSTQPSVAGSLLNSPRICGIDQFYTLGSTPAVTSRTAQECAPVCPLHQDAILTRDHVMRDHSRDIELIGLNDARQAFSIVEKNISGLPDLTALDQLCLNHVRSRLGPS